ncbi:MAG: hydantoinase B/oxoprolinase family protein [Nitriliruptoraceae bacterium]
MSRPQISTTDPIELELARSRFSAVANEMGTVLRRTAYSPNIKERADCSAAIFVVDGEMLAQAEHIPVHLGSMPASVQAVLDHFGNRVEPDTQYAVNDPFSGGTHLNDLTLVRPVHLGGDLIGFVANRAHHADVGGEAPGSMPAHATTITQEGCRIAPTTAVLAGAWLPNFLDRFLAATRTPAERLGDLSAQLGANEVGAQRLVELASSYGPGKFSRMCSAVLDYGEQRMRAALTDLTDGSYTFVDFMETTDALLPIQVTVTIDHDELHADFAGTADQQPVNFNAVRAVTQSCLYYAVRVATDPTIPANGGCQRPLSLTTAAGSLVDAQEPAAVAAGNVETSQRIADVLLGALATPSPLRVPAASQGTMNNLLIGSDTFAYYETTAGGQGGRNGRNGQSGIHTGMTNTRNTPIESLEQHYPFKVRATTLWDSGGAGRFRGGDGIERELEFLEPAVVSIIGERRRTRPWGLAGGSSGASGQDWLLRRRNGRLVRERLDAKCTFDVNPHDRLLVRTPGGGGWGKP